MRAPHYSQDNPAVLRAAAGPRLSVLLVEDDRADALLVEELIADAAADIEFLWSRTISDARLALSARRPDCVLLDLNLPDAEGIDALHRLGRLDPTIPIIVLTGLSDEHFGVSAVASGAQDYLVKGRVDPEMLRRAVLYSIERKRAELTAVALHASRLRAEENARLERGLLPSPLLSEEPGVDLVTRSLPSRRDALLGGGFYDVVQTPDRTVHVMIGDVAGHGPDEAALGVAEGVAELRLRQGLQQDHPALVQGREEAERCVHRGLTHVRRLRPQVLLVRLDRRPVLREGELEAHETIHVGVREVMDDLARRPSALHHDPVTGPQARRLGSQQAFDFLASFVVASVQWQR